MVRYGKVALLGVIVGAMLGALVGAANLVPSVVSGDRVAAELLPIGVVAAAMAGALVAVAAEFTAIVAVIASERFGRGVRRCRAAASGAAFGVASLAGGVWLVEGASMWVSVPMLALVVVVASLAAGGAWAGVRHADLRAVHEAERAAA